MALYDPELGENVTAFVGSEVDGMVTGLYGIVQWIDNEGNQQIAIMCAPGQTFVVSQGLLVVANAVADTELATYVLEATGGEDDVEP